MVTPNRICLQCGMPLSPGEAICSNCGKHNEPAAIDSMQRASSANSSASNSSLPQIGPAQFSPSTSFGNAYGQESQSYTQAPPSPDKEPAPSSPAGSFEPFGQQAPLPLPGEGDSSRLAPKKAPKMGIIIGAILLVLILAGSGLFFLSRGKGGSTNVTSNDAINTRTAAQPALFSDNFADDSKGWATGSGPGYNSNIGNNEMSLSEANHKILDEPVPGRNAAPVTFSDFSVTTAFTILKADPNDSAGLYLRGDVNLNQGYFIDIFGDNTYDIVKVFPDSSKDTFLISPTSSSAINPQGQQNKLTVAMKGSSIVLLINDKVVNSISDSTYTGGQIALFAENGRTSNGVNVTFNSVMVFPAPDKLPG